MDNQQENTLLTDLNVLVYHKSNIIKPNTASTDHQELQYIMNNFCGRVICDIKEYVEYNNTSKNTSRIYAKRRFWKIIKLKHLISRKKTGQGSKGEIVELALFSRAGKFRNDGLDFSQFLKSRKESREELSTFFSPIENGGEIAFPTLSFWPHSSNRFIDLTASAASFSSL